jgi:protein-L-isoaspartate(D-aspartate) O-methyltransferase
MWGLDNITAIKTARLAEEISKRFAISKEVFDAIVKTDRELFVPKGFGYKAYKLDALPISGAQWISSPLTVAKMTEYLEPKGADRILEIGCGSGYQAAVLSHIFRGVFTVERIEYLLLAAKERFKAMGINNIHTRFDDGQNGWVQYAPYERILFSASAEMIPEKIFSQLAEGGILVAPMQKDNSQIITKFVKKNGRILTEELEPCDFVPVVKGTQK